MGRKININISAHDYGELKGENVNINIQKVKPQYLTPREKVRLS